MPRSRNLAALLLAVPMLLTAGCSAGDAPSGDVTEETRAVDDFDELEARSAFDVTLVRADEPAVILTVNEDILDQVRTDVEDGRLVIKYEGSTENATLRAEVQHPGQLSGIRASGAASVVGDDTLSPERLELYASGAARIQVASATSVLGLNAEGASEIRTEGSTGELDIRAAGASSVDAQDTPAESAVVSAEGASRVTVNASVSLDLAAAGGSTIRYQGEGTVTKSEVSGGSTIETD